MDIKSCSKCGMENDGRGDHATIFECKAALKLRVTRLERMIEDANIEIVNVRMSNIAIYRERNLLAIAFGLVLCDGFQEELSIFGFKYEETDITKQWPVLYIDLPTGDGQVSWHIKREDLAEIFNDGASRDLVNEIVGGFQYNTEWDKHTTQEKYARLKAFIRTITAGLLQGIRKPETENCVD